MGSHRILFVDDDQALLDAIRRRHHKQYDLVTALGPEEGLSLLNGDGGFAVVVSDYQMPGMKGTDFLAKVQAHSPDSVRMLLTGQADMAATLEAVNHANIFRLLLKPCPEEELQRALDAALMQHELITSEREHRKRIEIENFRYDELLRAVFPAAVVDELKATDTIQPRRHDDVAVLFCDIVGFTSYCDTTEPEAVVNSLEGLFEAFEDISTAHGLEKTKTIGDAFMATAGLLYPVKNPVLNCVRAAFDMQATAKEHPPHWDLRMGIHIGPVSAGVIGRRQFCFDLWGDTVNVAARIEAHSAAGTVTVSEAAWRWIADRCTGASLGCVELKGKGVVELYRVDAIAS